MSHDIRSTQELPWQQFAAPLRSFIARRVPSGIEADDVLQDVFLRVIGRIDTLRDSTRLEAWLFQIARNAVRDALRARRRRDSRTDSLEFDLPAEPGSERVDAGEAELAACVKPLVARLAEPYRSAIELTSYEGLTQSAAAKRIGVSVPGMKSRVQRARDQLKRLLLTCCDVEIDRRGSVVDYRPTPAVSHESAEVGNAAISSACDGCSGRPSSAASICGERRLHS